MEPISATIAIIAAAKSAVETAQSIKDLGSSLEKLFDSHEGAEKKKKRNVATTRRQQILRMRSGDEGYDDDTSISAVANQVLEEKQKQIALEGLAKEINRKWGHGTWEQILDQRKKLLKEKAEAKKLAKERARQQKIDDKIFWHKVLVETGKVTFILCVVGFIGWWLHYAATTPKVR
jgi:hypothetical protein